MQRLLTTVTLSAWLGYCAVSAYTLSAEAFAVMRDGSGTGAAPAWLSTFVGDEVGATSFLALAGLFGAALYLLHVTQGRRAVAAAEKLSLGALGLTGLLLLVGAGAVAGPSVSTTVLLLLASASALLVDRLITVDEEEEVDLDAFDAGLAAVAEAMARQTRLYTPQYDERAGR